MTLGQNPPSRVTHRLAVLAIALFAVGTTAPQSSAPAALPVALKAAETLQATRMGVDRAGNLWAWNRKTESVAALSTDGRIFEPWKAPAAKAIDLDAEWGLVGLYELGNQIRWSRRGLPDVVLSLPAQSLDICWVGPATVAVTPLANEHRIEIWNLKESILAQSFGREPAIPRGPGAARLRSVLLRFDPARQRLYSLESQTGDLEVYDLEGKLLWRASFGNPDREEITSWLGKIDSEAKSRGTSQRPILLRLFPALDGQGNLWTAASLHPSTKTVELVNIKADRISRRSLPNLPCPSRTFTVWRDHILFYTDPASQRDACTSIGRFL